MASISKGKKAGMKKSIGGLFDQRTPISLIKFPLTLLLSSSSGFDLPKTIQDHANQFAALSAAGLPDASIFKEMGWNKIDSKNTFEQFKNRLRSVLTQAAHTNLSPKGIPPKTLSSPAFSTSHSPKSPQE
jgi:hypothetical protein